MREIPTDKSRPLVPVKQGTKVGRGRPRASLACSACRARKTKCDFMKSDDGCCSFCRSAGIECVNNHRDHRTKKDSNEAILRLTSRLESLESVLNQTLRGDNAELQLPTDIQTDTLSNDLYDAFLSTGTFLEPFLFSSTAMGNVWEAVPPSLELGDNPVPGGDETHGEVTSGLLQAQRVQHESQTINESAMEGFWGLGSELSPENVPCISAREGTAPCSDQSSPRSLVAFYGPTSQIYHISAGGSATSDDSELDSPDQMEIDLESEGIRRSILGGFWMFNEAWTIIVDRELFTRDKALGVTSEYYSRFLEDAMLACGSRHSSSNVIKSSGKRYANRAKATLVSQLQSPTIASIQGVLLLSAFEGTSGRPNFGWTLCGMAFRLLFDLGLHQDPSYLLQNRGFSIAELSHVQTLFLTTFCIDTVYAWFMGRPRNVPVPMVERVLASKAFSTTDDLTTRNLVAWSGLCIKAAQAQDIINNGKALDDQAMEQLSTINQALQEWYKTLQPELAWNDINIPALSPSAYGLHAEYFGIQIVLHTLSPKSGGTASAFDLGPDILPLPGFTRQQSRKLACENAIRIAQLAQTLDHVHGTEQIIPSLLCNMFSAGMVLRQCVDPGISSEGAPGPINEKAALAIILRILEDVGRHYPIAYRVSSVLCQPLTNKFPGNGRT